MLQMVMSFWLYKKVCGNELTYRFYSNMTFRLQAKQTLPNIDGESVL